MCVCSAQIFGPFVYGLTYAKTVGTFPRAIIFLAAGAVTVSCVLLAFVRLPPDPALGPGAVGDVEEQVQLQTAAHPEREETLVGEAQPLIVVDDEESGRKIIKP